MKRQIQSKYMMATTAIHLLGDISRDDLDICIVSEEDDENYYGNWVCGFGMVGVAFPKITTRELTSYEVETYHGRPIMMGGGFLHTINITGEDFHKHVVVTKDDNSKIRSGTLVAPIKVGRAIVMLLDDGRTWNTSQIQSIDGGFVRTNNSVYIVEYK